MKHPRDEEWLAYLDGEATPELRAHLNAHLKECRQCATEIEGWQRSIRALSRLDAPTPISTASAPSYSWLKWAAALALLAAGVAFGRLSAPSAAALRTELAAELAAQQQTLAEQLKLQLAEAMERERVEDQRWVAALLENDLSLRKDLETVATTADAGLTRANLRLTELASVNPALFNP